MSINIKNESFFVNSDLLLYNALITVNTLQQNLDKKGLIICILFILIIHKLVIRSKMIFKYWTIFI